MQGVKVKVFDGNLVPGSVESVLTAAAFGLANAHPVGGSVAGPGETVPLHKAFQQIDGMAVFNLPVAT